ncbi:MAG: D-aminoacylase [Thermosediminibacteraceae bacterium]|nr:D-aminoacylase [Thermosediminibacteraceae bacterium]
MYDIVILNGRVVDGTGNPWFYADIAVTKGRIMAVGRLKNFRAKKVLDASGLFVTPGFIDIHSHSDLEPMVNYKCESKVRQGVTTEVVGNCGDSAAPVLGQAYEEQRRSARDLYGIDAGWNTVAEYLEALERARPSINYAMLAGHGTIRKSVMGYERRQPTPEEMRRMKVLLKEAMEQGAFGLSTGLIYPPGSFAETGEIVELCRVAAENGGIYATHMRDEGERLEEAVEEAIAIGEKAGIPVEISHHKACGMSYFGKVERTLLMIKEARERSIDVTCDVYPYMATATGLTSIVPDWAHEGGIEKLIHRLQDKILRERIKKEADPIQKALSGYENVYITYVATEANRRFQGKSLEEVGAILNKNPLDAALDLIVEERGQVGMIRFAMDEEDVKKVLTSPFSMIGSDGSALAPYGILSGSHPHPRNYGTFPRVLARYVREQGILTLEEAVRKMTSFPARRLGLWDRGIIMEGMAADIVIFDLDKVKDMATYENPKTYPKGIVHVIVNGVPVISEGKHTGARPGRVLRNGLWRKKIINTKYEKELG